MRPTTLLLLLASIAILAGCAVHPPAPPVAAVPETPVEAQERRTQASRPAYNLAGYPAAVRDGYIDGCETAKATRYGRKDAGRFSADAQYQMGWNDGYAICGKR